LKAKMYCLSIDDHDHMRAKRASKTIVKMNLTLDHYRRALLDQKFVIEQKKNISILSTGQQLFTTAASKQTLSPTDNKLWMIDHESTYPHGHYMIERITKAQMRAEEELKSFWENEAKH